jgi:predicted amidophosphoribosyltransferase
VICAACQSANEDDALFCEHCGQPLEQPCPSCGTPARALARFCRKCGQNLGQPTDPGQPVPPPPPSSAHAAVLDDARDRLQRDLPPHLIEKIRASRGR